MTDVKALSHHETRNDRSIRLWGAEGQALLENCKSCFLGVTAATSEVAKNLILPGIGEFTIVDDTTVTRRDVGSNFFLDHQDIGSPSAPSLMRNLKELNPSSKGKVLEMSPIDLIHKQPKYFESNGFGLVIVSSRVDPDSLRILSELLAGTQTVIAYVAAVGLLGFLRVQAPTHYVTRKMLDEELKIHDLCCFDPFPKLKAWFDAHHPNDPTLPVDLHSHLPYFLLIHFAVQIFRQERNDPQLIPKAGAEWKRIREIVTSMIRRKLPNQENFMEALAKCNASIHVATRNIPTMRSVMEDVRTTNPSAGDDIFWFFAHGISKFRAARGAMPCTGDLPDFTCTTGWYTELQSLFQEKAAEDAAVVLEFVQSALKTTGRNPEEVSLEVVRGVTKHGWELAVVSYTLLKDESLVKSVDAIGAGWWAVHSAARRFFATNLRHPGDCGDEFLEDDRRKLWSLVDASMVEGAHENVLQQQSDEMVRYGGGEPVFTASTIGALCAQECIKIVQHKRVPAAGAVVYDGNSNVTHVVTIL